MPVGLDFALYLDPNTQMLSQVPNSAGIGKEIKSLNPNNDAYIPFNNYALGGRRKIGCLNYEFVSSKNNDGIDMDMTNYINGHEGHIAWPNPTAQREFYKDNWPTLGEKFYAYDDGNGQYCPNTFKWSGTAYPCPAYPCWNGPPETPETTDPPPHVGAPPHFGAPPNRELLVMHSNSSSSNTTSNNTTSANAMSPAQLGKRGSVKKLPSGSL